MPTLLFLLLPLAALGCTPGAGSAGAKVLDVSAAASTAGAVTEIARLFERTAGKGIAVRCSFAASSTLAKQIESGAPASVFLSADARWLHYLEGRGLVLRSSRRDVAGNTLALVAPLGRPFPVRFERGFSLGAAFEGRLAVGDPEHVPVGAYARQALESSGWWDGVKDRLLPAADAPAALHLVELGEARAGIVYGSDARASERIEVLGVFPPGSHEPILYAAALLVSSGEEAARFLEFLRGEEASAAFQRHHFEAPR